MKRLLSGTILVTTVLVVSVCVAQDNEKDDEEARAKLKESFDTPSAFKIGDDDKVKASVPKDEIIRGIRGRGDPRDVIPPIYEPEFESIVDASPHYENDDRVLVYTSGEITRAYPHKVLTRHEIVNDEIDDASFVVVFCPLCLTGSVFDRKIDGVVRKFGVSGYLYNSDVLLWDDLGESFWSQVEGKAVAGPETDTELKWLHVLDITFAKFKKDHPKGEVLVGPGPRRTYDTDPYKARGYDKDDTPGFLSKDKADRRMHQKAVVTGVTVSEKAFCIPHEEVAKVETPVEVTFGEDTLIIEYDAEADAVSVKKKPNEEEAGESRIVTLRAYWFAWAVFHPETTVFEVTEDMKRKEKADDETPDDKSKEEAGGDE